MLGAWFLLEDLNHVCKIIIDCFVYTRVLYMMLSLSLEDEYIFELRKP